jgi:hypothetical protein
MHMPNRMGNFLAAILIGSLASVSLAHAADNCLSGPKGAAPKGSHWYYRIDHATKRNCWYVRAEGGKPAASRLSPVAEAAPQPEAPLQPAIANARAEASPVDVGPSSDVAVERAPSGTANNAQASNAPTADSGQSAVASRWPDQTGADTITGSTSKPDNSGASINPSAPAAVAPLAAADARSLSSGAVSTLFLVMVGALAIAGLLAGAVYRFGSAQGGDRQEFRREQRAPWDSIDVGAIMRSPPLAAEAAASHTGPARERQEAIIPDEIVQLLSRLSKEAAA